MLDWLGKLIGLPPVFLACSGGKGGGVIQVPSSIYLLKFKIKLIKQQGTASEAMLVALLAARSKKVKQLKEERPEEDEKQLATKLVAYSTSRPLLQLISFHRFVTLKS